MIWINGLTGARLDAMLWKREAIDFFHAFKFDDTKFLPGQLGNPKSFPLIASERGSVDLGALRWRLARESRPGRFRGAGAGCRWRGAC